MLALALALTLSADDCEWKDLKERPKLEATVGYELGGTGEFQILPPKGRALGETGCP